ncbi:MAG: DHHA2 domain-containing protein, partial [Patescibacteria group bacterium]
DVSELFLLNNKVAADKVIEIIDHRLIGQLDDFKNAKKQIELVGSAATLVAERFFQNNVEMSQNSAILLLSAIISNTLNFKGSVTTDRDKNVAEELFKISQLPRDYFRELFAAKSDLTGEKLKAALLAEITVTRIIAGKRMVMPQLEIIGSEKLVADRLQEIISILQDIQNKDQLDFIFLNLVDLENGRNYFVTSDSDTKNLIGQMFNLDFVGDYATRDGLILRKQIWPMTKNQLEKV